jgi:hypothetical protein
MIMADVLTWFLIIIGILLVFNAHWLAAYALFPNLVAASRERYAQRPIAATLLGLVILVPTIAIGAVLINVLKHPLVAIIIIGLWMIPTVLALLGSAGLAARIGAGLSSPQDHAQPWRSVLRGSTVLSLTFLTPILGWFVLFPWTLVSGLGVAIMALRHQPRAITAISAATVLTNNTSDVANTPTP